MADIQLHDTPTQRRGVWQTLVDLLAPVGQRFVTMGENSSRYRRLERLNAMTDAQLAERGMQREDIVRHVFADVYYV